MKRPLLILRPQPGADATAARAAALGLITHVAPLFTVGAVAWELPDPAGFDAVLLTSANAIRHGGADVARLTRLPAFAVGTATAAAARRAGFTSVEAGGDDAAAIVALAFARGARRLLHLAGREHRPADHPGATITRRIVYAADPVTALPDAARDELAAGAVTLLHSPRAAGLFRSLAGASGLDVAAIRIAAISPAALAAAGNGWEAAISASDPTDDALLAAAARLCD